MEVILKDVERALSARLYYLAIMMSLTIPDVCAALETNDGKTSPNRYTRWCKDYLVSKYSLMTTSDFWRLRCAVLHQGRSGNKYSRYTRVIFQIQENRSTLHHNLVFDALILDSETFCRDMLASARAWHDAKKGDANVMRNLPQLMQFRPDGLKGYDLIKGLPAIA